MKMLFAKTLFCCFCAFVTGHGVNSDSFVKWNKNIKHRVLNHIKAWNIIKDRMSPKGEKNGTLHYPN
jgi:hypothetical protein